jgi:hypothetical protein
MRLISRGRCIAAAPRPLPHVGRGGARSYGIVRRGYGGLRGSNLRIQSEEASLFCVSPQGCTPPNRTTRPIDVSDRLNGILEAPCREDRTLRNKATDRGAVAVWRNKATDPDIDAFYETKPPPQCQWIQCFVSEACQSARRYGYPSPFSAIGFTHL